VLSPEDAGMGTDPNHIWRRATKPVIDQVHRIVGHSRPCTTKLQTLAILGQISSHPFHILSLKDHGKNAVGAKG